MSRHFLRSQLYSHEVPEIITIAVERGLPDYLHWVPRSTSRA